MGKQFFNTLIIILLSSLFSIKGLVAQECLPPDYSDVYNITGTSATIYWEDYYNNGSWDIVVSPNAISNPSSVAATATVTGQEMVTYDAHGLTPETLYHYYIRTNCASNSHSEWISGSFTTRCADKNIPYSNNFNNYEPNVLLLPDCWTNVQGTASVTSYDATHENVLQLPGYCVVALPSFVPAVNTLRIQFSAQTTNANATLQVGVIRDLSDISTFTVIGVISQQSAYVFYEKTVNFGNYTGEGLYIAFRNTGSYTQYVDDLTVSIIPNCLSPDNVQASNIHATSATLTWNETGTATQWHTLLSTTPITNFNTQNPATSNSTTYNASSLTPNTTYYFYVRAACSSDNSEWASVTFSTPCSPSPMPVSESFTYNQVPACWGRERVVGNSDVSFVGYGNNPSCDPAEGSAMVQWSSGSNGVGWQARLVSPPLNTTGVSSLDVNFKWYHDLGNSNGLGDGIQIQYSTDGVTWSNSAQGMIHRYDGIHSGWTEYDVILSEAGNLPEVYVAFLFTTGGGGSNCYLDEVTFQGASGCFTPVNVSVGNIVGNSATLTWDEVGSASAWHILLSQTPVTDFSTVSPFTVTNTSYTFNNLNPSTTYYAYVRSKCSGSSFSQWSPAATFTTDCGTILSLPYEESFDRYGTCTNAFPPCWIRYGQPELGIYSYGGHTCSTPSATDLNAIDGDKSLMVCTPSGCFTYTITPPIQEDIRNIAVTFFLLKSADATGTLEVGIMSNPNDPITFESITTVNPSVSGEWEFFPVSFASANLSGSGNRIAFRHYGMIDENYYLLDGISILEAPDCWSASQLTVSGITGNSATLSWIDPNTPAAQWAVKISDVPMSNMSQTANVFDQTVSAAPVTLDYLTGGTTYHYYIQSDCGGATLGDWDHGTFTTLPCNCYVDIFMNDAAGNGWQGAKIQLKHGTTVFAEATMYNGAHDTARIYTCENSNIDYYFVAGSSDADISFTIVNSLGTTLYTSNGTPSAGCFTSGVPACGISCGTAPANLTATAADEGRTLTWNAAPNALSYSVYRSDILIADYVTETSYTDTEAGPNDTCYTVTAQCIVGESGHSNEACVHLSDVHVTDVAGSHSVSIFPNPANSRFTVTAGFPLSRVTIVNLLEQEVISKEVTGNRAEINVSELPDGIYLVKIMDGNSWIVRKIIVE